MVPAINKANHLFSVNHTSKKFNSSSSPPKFRHFADQIGPKGDPIKISFDTFQMLKWSSQTVRARKADKKWSIFSYLFPDLWSLNRQKFCPFCRFLLVSGCCSNLWECIWKFSFCSFGKCYWLLCYDLELRRYECLKLKDFGKFLLSQYFSSYFIL